MSIKNVQRVQKILDALIHHYKLKGYPALAEFIGVKYHTLMAWKKRGSIGDYSPFMDKCPGINLAWLETGEGEMFRGVTQDETKAEMEVSHRGAAATGEGEAGLLPLNPEDVVVMQVYITGGAGAPYEFIPSEPIEEIILPRAFYTKSIIPVKVRGRSMERTLRDGAVVGVDRSDRQIVNGELFAVWLPYQGTVIKRLYLDNKKILLQSDNEEFRSRDIEVALDEVDENFVQGRVKWAIQML